MAVVFIVKMQYGFQITAMVISNRYFGGFDYANQFFWQK